MEVRCEPATRPASPRRWVSTASVSTWRDSGIVGLVAMHVDQQPALGGDLAQARTEAAPILHGALEMRDAADDIDAEIEGANGDSASPLGAAIEAVLRKGDELQVEVGCDFLLHLEQGFDRQQPVIADIDMGADAPEAPWKPPSRNRRAPAR